MVGPSHTHVDVHTGHEPHRALPIGRCRRWLEHNVLNAGHEVLVLSEYFLMALCWFVCGGVSFGAWFVILWLACEDFTPHHLSVLGFGVQMVVALGCRVIASYGILSVGCGLCLLVSRSGTCQHGSMSATKG